MSECIQGRRKDRFTATKPMQQSFAEQLMETPPRETSGSRSSNRFDFQKSWALVHLVKLHRAGTDYMLVMEHHEDVVVLDSSTDPQCGDFFQVKTHSRRWTKNALLQRGEGRGGQLSSILGNLVRHRIVFDTRVRTLNLISNQSYRLRLPSGQCDSEEVCLVSLHQDELAEILDKVREEHGLEQNPDCAGCTHLAVTSLPLREHDTYAFGVFGELVDDTYPGEKVASRAAYRVLRDEIRRTATCEELPRDFDSLSRLKAITRAGFQSFIDDIRPREEYDGLVDRFCQQLQLEGWDWRELQRLRSSAMKYEVRRMDRNDVSLCRLRNQVESAVRALAASNGCPATLGETIRAVEGALDPSVLAPFGSETLFVRSIIAVALYELI